MRYVETEEGSWIGHQDDLESTLGDLKQTDHIIADLDFTLARCLATRLPFYDLKFWEADSKTFNPLFIRWSAKSAFRIAKSLDGYDRQLAVEESWLDYFDTFLAGNPKNLAALEKLAEKKLDTVLYPGVKEFSDKFPDTKKIILTRNIDELTRPFAKYLNYEMHTNAIQKGQKADFLRGYLSKISGHVTLIGDQEALDEPLTVAKEYVPEHNLISIYVSKNKSLPSNLKPDLHIPRDYRGLSKNLETILLS